MKILFDVTELMLKELTTEGIYAKYLFRILRGLGVDIDPVFSPPAGFKDNHIEYHINFAPKKFRLLFTKKGSLLHGPNGSLLSESPKLKKVLSINDLSMFHEGILPGDVASRLQSHLKQQIQMDPEAVIVPTQTLHNEVLVRFPKMINKVHVIPPGCDHMSDNRNVADQPVTESPYFLFNGSFGKRGNLSGVVKSFSGIAKSNSKVKLVITGYHDYGSEGVLNAIQKSDLSDRVLIRESASPALLKKMYSDAIALVVPSNYDGFNFPMMEAMRVGCPVIASSFGSNKDVAGEAAHFVNPKFPEQIMSGMERIFVDRTYRQKLVDMGYEVSNGLTWLACGKEISKIYSSIS